MRSVLLCLLGCAACAVETKPVYVVKVIDGTTFEVAADLGGCRVPIRVRLAYVAVPPAAQPADYLARRFLRIALPVDALVVLSSPGAVFSVDDDGALLALVVKADLPEERREGPTVQHADGTSSTEITIINPRFPLQAKLVEAGYGVYSRVRGDAPPPWHEALIAGQDEARNAKRGAWSTAADWMRDNAHEHTAPMKEKP